MEEKMEEKQEKHLVSPKRLVKKISVANKPDGIVMKSTPTTSSRSSKTTQSYQRIWIHQTVLTDGAPKKSFHRSNTATNDEATSPAEGKKVVRRKSLTGSAAAASATASPPPLTDEPKEWEWVQGRITKQDEKGLVVELLEGTEIPFPGHERTGRTITVPAASLTTAGKVLLANEYTVDKKKNMILCPDDLTDLTHLHEPSVIECLQERFHQSQIYTRTGPVLIALNPFEKVTYLYTHSVMASYWDRAEQSGPKEDIAPHVFEIADHAFRQMLRSLDAQIHVAQPVGCQQAILVSGESGAGKTVTTKLVMKYLATLSERLAAMRSNPELHRSRRKDDQKSTVNPSSRFSAMSKKVMAQPQWAAGSASSSNNNSLVRSPVARGRSQVRRGSLNAAAGPPMSPQRRMKESVNSAAGPPMSPQRRMKESCIPPISPRVLALGPPKTAEPPTDSAPPPRARSRSRSRGPAGKGKSGGGDGLGGTSHNGIEAQVLQSNPILESFGNARTVRNDNSSRFGKFIEMQFTRLGKLVGAQIETYLLEKVRLVKQSPGERNYHVFYEILSGEVPEEELAVYHLDKNSKPTDFSITNASGTFDRRDKVSDADTYLTLREAINTMGFDANEQHNIFGVVAAVLHGSNLKFEDHDDAASLKKNNPHLNYMCQLMGLQMDDLEKALCTANVTINKNTFERRLTVVNAEKGLESLLKSCYGALFTFLVQRVNDSVACRKCDDPMLQPVTTVGVLDIFGFETFTTNSFEQLCINFCNETLQQQFNAFVLENEQAEYQKEGIDWSFIDFPENQDVLDLIEKRGKGILNILDDHCRSPQPKDSAYALDVYKICGSHPRFSASTKQTYSMQMTIQHYAGPVEYTMDKFTEKNSDDLPKEAIDLLQNSTNKFIQKLARIIEHGHDLPAAIDGSEAPSRSEPSSQRSSVGEQFRRQLKNLRVKIDRTSPHYIRCLKPNSSLEAGIFDVSGIAEQLRCGGILEAVRVSRAGFAQHFPHADFVARYGDIVGIKHKRSSPKQETRKVCEKLVERLKNSIFTADGTTKASSDRHIQMGKTKVFLTKMAFEILEQSHGNKKDIAATKLNAVFRGFLARVKYPSLRSEYLSDVAERKRQEELEKEARARRKAAERERRIRQGLPLEDSDDDEAKDDGKDPEKLKADFEFNKLLGYHKDVLVKVSKIKVDVSVKNTDELKWVCENGQWVRRKVVASPASSTIDANEVRARSVSPT